MHHTAALLAHTICKIQSLPYLVSMKNWYGSNISLRISNTAKNLQKVLFSSEFTRGKKGKIIIIKKDSWRSKGQGSYMGDVFPQRHFWLLLGRGGFGWMHHGSPQPSPTLAPSLVCSLRKPCLSILHKQTPPAFFLFPAAVFTEGARDTGNMLVQWPCPAKQHPQKTFGTLLWLWPPFLDCISGRALSSWTATKKRALIGFII